MISKTSHLTFIKDNLSLSTKCKINYFNILEFIAINGLISLSKLFILIILIIFSKLFKSLDKVYKRILSWGKEYSKSHKIKLNKILSKSVLKKFGVSFP